MASKKAIAYLQQHPAFWETLEEEEETIRFATEDDHWAAADIPILQGNWETARRCVIYREAHETESTDDSQLTMMVTTYTFQAIITNTELKPLPLLRTYNQRANIENRIDELKDGYAIEQNSLHYFMRNLLFCWIKVISCNLMVWFKQSLLPEDLQKCEIKNHSACDLEGSWERGGFRALPAYPPSTLRCVGRDRHRHAVADQGVCQGQGPDPQDGCIVIHPINQAKQSNQSAHPLEKWVVC